MIFLLRHGDAEPDEGEGDAARELTKRAGGSLTPRTGDLEAGLQDRGLLASSKVRARDTALLACAHLDLEPEICRPIADGYYDTLELVAGRGNAMLVGHEPDMSSEVSRLTGSRIKLKKGGLAVLEPSTLHVLLRPAELAAIAGD